MAAATPAPDFGWIDPLPMFPPATSTEYDAGRMYSVSVVSGLVGGCIALCIAAVC
eukprot:CAMPEP_0182913336 /NCGR_PEP_ID=MMETSP0034_2-20130328/37987_1 /TAXON_ID=156128 /ORGANISM="Nephroselmis pyriformis, Strain CCMP717" /LENGTH=54 /DNA_ID=CAMNT_0025050053 /DNA_START=231 /DNA_END=392 /DNA_ORIENTATION=+